MALEETRRRVLDAAIGRVVADEMNTGLEHVRLEDAVRDADVSRTAAYRCWPNREDFLADLMVALVPHALPIVSTRGARATAVVRRAVGDGAGDLRTVDGRRGVLRRVVSMSADDDLLADLDEHRRWRLYLTLAMAVPALPEGERHDRVAAAVAAGEETVLGRLEENYRRLLDLFGFTSQVPYRRLAEIGLAMMRGYVVGGHAGAGSVTPGEGYALLVDAAASPSDPSDWNEGRARQLLDALAGSDVFDGAAR